MSCLSLTHADWLKVCKAFNITTKKVYDLLNHIGTSPMALLDSMTPDKVERLIDLYNNGMLLIEELNKSLSKKKIRKQNYPSEITENLVKFFIHKTTGVMGCWDTEKGDLDVGEKKVEVKGGFITMGPPTFGPREMWDEIYFVDCQETLNKKFKIYAIELSNTSEEWKNLKVSKSQTYYAQCLEGRRPRLTFDSIQAQLGDHCRLVFDGHFDELK